MRATGNFRFGAESCLSQGQYGQHYPWISQPVAPSVSEEGLSQWLWTQSLQSKVRDERMYKITSFSLKPKHNISLSQEPNGSRTLPRYAWVCEVTWLSLCWSGERCFGSFQWAMSLSLYTLEKEGYSILESSSSDRNPGFGKIWLCFYKSVGAESW